MFGRRLLVLVAVLMGLTALAATLSPPPESLRRTPPSESPTPSATPPPATPPSSSDSVNARISATAPRARHVTASVGDLVTLDVTGDVVDTVVIDDLAVVEPIDPDSPAQVELYAGAPGRYPIRLLSSGRSIGTLRIEPA
jgi:hypothetical protein